MRILQLAPIWETVPPPAYGGTETVISALTEELVRRGHEVTLCASGDSITSARLLSFFPRSLRQAGLLDHAMQYSLVHVACSLREAGRFDLVHNHSGPPSELGMALSRLVDVPVLTTLHNPLTPDTRYIWSSYGGWYNAISQAQIEQLPRLPRARFAGVVHNGIDLDNFDFDTEKDRYLLFIGRIVADKAPHLAVEAARRAGRRIVLAGKISEPEEHAYFRDVIKPLLGDPNVEFVGEADATLKRKLYRKASALLLPLQWDEPFGLVMIEAMASGTPVIAFRRGAAPEIVRDGRTGFLVDDVAGMVRAIDACDAINPHACRRLVEERFSPAGLADRYLEVYERITGIHRFLERREHA